MDLRLFAVAYIVQSVFSASCYHNMVYEKPQGYIYTIVCKNLNQSTNNELKNISTRVKVKLTINQSQLRNLTRHTFKSIPNIKELIIKNSLMCNTNGFPERLESLSLANNSLSDLQKNIFENLKQLRALNLSHNNFNNFLCANVQELDLSYNKLTKINVSCKVLQINRLYLSHNLLESIPHHFLPLLSYLDLSFNKITHTNSFKYLPYLTKLYLNNNDIITIDGAFSNLDNLIELNLAGNNIVNIEPSHFSHIALKTLNLNNNCIHNVVLGQLSIFELHLEHNCLINLSNFTAVKQIHLSHNSINLHTVSLLGQVTHLYLKNCNIHTVNTELQPLKSLELLDLSHNQLKQLNEVMFDGLKQLSVLDLSYNDLSKLHENTLKPLQSLQHLNLNYNSLLFIDYKNVRTYLKNIRVVYMQYNRFTCDFLKKALKYFNDTGINFEKNENLLNSDINIAGYSCRDDKLSNLWYLFSLVAVIFAIGVVVRYLYLKTKLSSDEVELMESRLNLRLNLLAGFLEPEQMNRLQKDPAYSKKLKTKEYAKCSPVYRAGS
ncbi:hypothetical protein FQA39_LY16614 [Lamprigera yunnana]|nr:hypothetical protein FQA39_LY16614 [Lamprigera yunnana]